MILKIFGITDILAIIALLTSAILPQKIIILLALYLIIKGLFFVVVGSIFPNIFDIAAGFYLFIVSFGITNWIATTIVIIFLLQKAIISIL